MAVHCGLLPWRGVEQLHLVRVRVLYTGTTTGCLWVAHDWEGSVCDLFWTADRSHSGLHLLLLVHSRDECLYFCGGSRVGGRVHSGPIQEGRDRKGVEARFSILFQGP